MLVRHSGRPANRVFGNWTPLTRMLDDTFGIGEFGADAAQVWLPAVDITEDPKRYSLSLEVPGVRPEDVRIEVDGNRLVVSGEKTREAREDSPRLHRFERSYGSFQRSFVLPETVNTPGIEARTEHGVLTIALPKTEKAQPRTIPVG